MANQDFPFGFRAIRNVAGTAPQIQEFANATRTGHIFEGGPVALNASAYITMWTNTLDVGELVGVAVHSRLTTDTDRTVKVYTGRDQEYEVQLDDDSITTLAGLLTKPNYVVWNPAAGSSTTYQSTAELDASSATSTNTLANNAVFRVNRFSRITGQVNTTAHQRVIGRFVDVAQKFVGDMLA